MTDQSREEILANFQACTGIEDISEALNVLEQADWDLTVAVNNAIPFEVSQPPSLLDTSDDVEMIEEIKHTTPSVSRRVTRQQTATLSSQASTSKIKSSSSRTLYFTVHFKDQLVLNIELPDSANLMDLKRKLQESTNVLPCQQLITGWMRVPPNDSTPLAGLSLPAENILFLNALPSPTLPLGDEADTDIAERLKRQYTLNIRDETSNKSYSLKFPGSKMILEVKTDVYSLTDIPVRHQMWTGWPDSVSDSTCLAISGISYPSHDLTIKKSVITSTRNATKEAKDKHRKVLVDLVDSDTSSVEEFEDASESFNIEDDIFIDNIETKKIEPLIPENVEEEEFGSIHFSERFSMRYGAHPVFYIGTLEEAIKEACHKPARERRLLAVYLHHDGSVLSNVFCTQLLGFESVLQTFEANFVVWGWDVTHESNRTILLNSVNSNLGSVASMTVRSIPVDKYPVLILIMKMRSSTEIYTVIHGNVGVSELLGGLMEAVEVWTEQQRTEVREEQERADRELVKREQDEAYRESLEADRAKEAAKREQEAQAKAERAREEKERAETAARREAQRKALENSLPPEPLNCGEGIARIRFRLPKGQTIDRRFRCSDNLQVLLNFLTVEGYPTDEYKVISSWPRRDLTAIDSSKSLQELKLCPQETVMLEER